MAINLRKVTQGERGTLTFTWEFPENLSSPASISGATITATMTDENGETTAVSGTLTGTAATTCTWALSAGDSGTAGTFTVLFKAVAGGVTTYTLQATLEVISNPEVTGTQNDPLVSISTDDAAWIATSAGGGDLGSAAYADTADFDAAGAATAAQAAAAALVDDLSGVTSEPSANALGLIGLSSMLINPIRDETVVALSSPMIMDYLGNRLYGYGTPTPGLLTYSDDDGGTWATLQNTGTGDTLRSIYALPDGEVLLQGNGGLYRSTGWATSQASATWTTVLSPTSGAYFLEWGLDVYQSRVIVSEYAVSPRDPSKKVWVSLDAGLTFTEVLNLDDLFPGNEAGYHWHGVCIDPWADGRFWAWAGDDTHVAYYSDDDGETFTEISSTMGNMTTMTATTGGIVLGSDSNNPQGLFMIQRKTNPADMAVELMYNVRISQNTFGFAARGIRNKRTNTVYVIMRSNYSTAPGYLLASPDGLVGGEIYKFTTSPVSSMRMAVNDSGTKLAIGYNDGTVRQMTAAAPGIGINQERLESGGVLGGVADSTGIAIGNRSSVPGVGVNIAQGGTAVSRSINIGSPISVPDLTVIIGTSISQPVSYATYSVAIGDGVAIAEQGTSIGARSQAIATAGALGYLAKGLHARSVAIGNSTNTQAADQVAVGSRDIEIQNASRGIILRDTNGTRYRITVDTSGALVVTAL